MNRIWIWLMATGVLLVVAFSSWDLYLTFTGQKGEFSYSLNPIEPGLYEQVEEHFRQGPKFSEYQQQATQELSLP